VEEYLVENAAIIAPICLAVICCAIVFVIRRRRLAEKENINKLVDKIRARLSAQRREASKLTIAFALPYWVVITLT